MPWAAGAAMPRRLPLCWTPLGFHSGLMVVRGPELGHQDSGDLLSPLQHRLEPVPGQLPDPYANKGIFVLSTAWLLP